MRINRRNKWLYCIIVLVICFISCAETVDLDPRERIVVVNCILGEDSIQTVDLRYTSYVSEEYYPIVEDAVVFIEAIENEESAISKFNFRKINDYTWKSSFIPKEGVTYKLTVKIPDLKDITAITVFPKGSFNINSVYDSGLGVVLHTKDERPVESGDYGYIAGSILFMYDLEGDSQNRLEIGDSSAFWIYGVDFNPTSNKFFVTEYIYSEHDGIDKFNVSNIWGNQINEFSKRGYDIDFPDILSYGIPMYFPSISLYDNSIDKQFFYKYIRIPLNCFADYSLHYTTNSNIDNGHSGRCQYLPNFKHYNNGVAHPYAHLVFEQVSKEYDKYLKSVFNFQYGLRDGISNDDIINIYDYKEVYTNINNGVGIFGCSKKRLILWANAEYIFYKDQIFYNKNYISQKYQDSIIKENYLKYNKLK